MTHGDKIRKMNNEQLAEFLCDKFLKGHLKAAITEWLYQHDIEDIISIYLEDHPDDMDAHIRRLYVTEGIIPAIKYHRNLTEVGLADSKQYVENLCVDLRRAR